MRNKKKKFNLGAYFLHRKQTLSFFGENRYHDWVMLLGVFVILTLGVVLCAVYVYVNVTRPNEVMSTLEVRKDDEDKPIFLGFPETREIPSDSIRYIDPSR